MIALTVTIGVTFEVVTAYLPLYASYGGWLLGRSRRRVLNHYGHMLGDR